MTVTHKLRIIFLLALETGVFALFLSGCNRSESGFTREQWRQAATALQQQQLYAEAIETYSDYLHSAAITPDDAPKVLYQMGVLAQDQLRDCQKALSHFTILKSLYPDESFGGQVGKRMVACLEIMGRSADAALAASRLTTLNPSQMVGTGNATPTGNTSAAGIDNSTEGGSAAAELDGQIITWGEVEQAFGQLPENPRDRFQAARVYVAQRLAANAARRKGLNDKPELKRRLLQIEDQVLAEAVVREEIKIPTPSGNDLQYFFEGNKTRYLVGADSGKTFEDLRPRILKDWSQEKQATATQDYLERLLKASPVKFHTPPGAEPAAASAQRSH